MVSAWKRVGYAVIVLLAGLKSIPGELSEAARIDGAGPWQLFVSVTLPLLRGPLILVTIVLTLSNLNTVETPLVSRAVGRRARRGCSRSKSTSAPSSTSTSPGRPRWP